MYLEVLSKIASESLLSLYPLFVKYINIPFSLQVWSRFFTYMVIAFLFANSSFIVENILTKNGILLSIITIAHVFCSYRGFQLLESGQAYIIFYTYPLMILLLAGKGINFIMIFAIIGVFLLAKNEKESFTQAVFEKSNVKERFRYEGIIMILIAALTEAFIYFIVRDIKTTNNWNHIFISYALGALFLSIYYYKDIKNSIPTNTVKTLTISMVINIVIGLFGNFFRFFAISRLDANIYAPLSYFGVLMAYIYGVIINKDVITINKIIGSICILIPNIANYLQ